MLKGFCIEASKGRRWSNCSWSPRFSTLTEQEEPAAKPATKEPLTDDSPEDAAKETSLRSRKKPAAKSSGKETDKSKAAPGDKVLHSYWLMKSEPESRIENGVDVKV